MNSTDSSRFSTSVAQQRREVVDSWRRCQFPRRRFETYTVDPIDQRAASGQRSALTAARDWSSQPHERVASRTNLILIGTVGTGKDHLAIAAVREFAMADYTVAWLDGCEFRRRERDRIGGGRSESEHLLSYFSAQVLLISDPTPGLGALSIHQAAQLQDVADERERRGLLTVMTINARSEDQAGNELGWPTWDRIKNRAWIVPMLWRSERRPERIIKPQVLT